MEKRRRIYLAFCPAIWTHCPFHHQRQDSQCTEDEAMLESMGEGEGLGHDKTSSSTSKPEQELELGQDPEPEQQPELDAQPSQQPELDPELEQQPEWEQDQKPIRPQHVHHTPKCLHIIH